MPLNHTVRLVLGPSDVACDRWDGYTITQSMFEAGNAWSFEVWRSEMPTGAWDVLTARVRAGDWINFFVDDALQLVGQVDARSRGAARSGAKFVLSGRDLAAAAIDSDADPRIHLSNATLEDAATVMLGKVALDVVIGADADAAREVQTSLRTGPHGMTANRRRRRQPVGRFHPKPGEKIWGLLQTMCRKVGLLCWPTISPAQTLAIVFDVPNYDQAPLFRFDRIEVDGVVAPGSTILEGWDDVDVAGIPTDVYVSGHAADGDAPPSRFRAQVHNGGLFFDDTRVSPALGLRQRFITSPRSTEHDTATQDADRVICDANRKLRRYRCTVEDHGQVADGRVRLYAINTVAHVADTVAGVDEDMLIERVTFKGSRTQGQTTELVLHPLHAVQLVPDPSQA